MEEEIITRYQKYMQRIHNQATASSIEQAARHLLDDVSDYLIMMGVKADSKLISQIKTFDSYQYKPGKHLKPIAEKSGIKTIDACE